MADEGKDVLEKSFGKDQPLTEPQRQDRRNAAVFALLTFNQPLGENDLKEMHATLTPEQIALTISGLQSSRDPNGSSLPTSGAGLNITSLPSLSTAGGGSVIFTKGQGGMINLNGGTFTATGGIIYIDPPGQVNLNGLNFSAFGPQIFATILPPPPILTPPDIHIDLPEIQKVDVPMPYAGSPVVATDSAQQAINDKQQDTAILSTTQAMICYPTGLSTPQEVKGVKSWTVASGVCQSFAFDSKDDTTIIGSGGTCFVPEASHTLLLKEGKIVTFTGKLRTVVETSQGNVDIPPESSALIEQKSPGMMRIANLGGSETDVSITRNGRTQVITQKPGEELVVADASLADEELIPIDGIEREPISAAITISGLKIQKRRFNVKSMMEREQMVSCNLGCFPVTIRRKIDRVKDAAGAGTTHKLHTGMLLTPNSLKSNKVIEADGSAVIPTIMLFTPDVPQTALVDEQSWETHSPADESTFKPISYMQPGSPAGAFVGLRKLSYPTATVRHSGKTQVLLERPGVVALKDGETLIDTQRPTAIKAGSHSIYIAGGTIALVGKTSNLLAIRNLCERMSRSIRLDFEGRSLKIAAGEEIIVGPSGNTLVKTFKNDLFSRRRISRFDIGGGNSVVKSDISLVSLMQRHEVMSRLVHSSNPSDHALAEKVIKMAACIHMVTAKKGAYAPMTNP